MYSMYSLGNADAGSFGAEGPPRLRNAAIGQKIASTIGRQLQTDAAAKVGADRLLRNTVRQELLDATVDAIRAQARVPPNLSDACKCYTQAAVDFAVSKGAPPPPADVVAQLAATCAVDEAGFQAALKAGGVSVSKCAPIWKRPSTWVLGGAVFLGLFLVLR